MSSTLLTPRDTDILSALDRCPLTAGQLLTLSETFSYPFTSERKVRARMQVLAESGRVRRWPYLAIDGRVAPTYYTLTRKGYRLLYGADAIPHVRRAFDPVAIGRQRHTYAMAQFIVATFVAAKRAGVQVVNFGRENSVCLTAGQEQLYPDTTLTLLPPWGGAFHFCVEIDGGTERMRSEKDVDSWERKIRLYEAVQDAATERYRVLAVSLDSQIRSHNILSIAAGVARNPCRCLVYGITLESYLQHPLPLTSPCFMDHCGRKTELLKQVPTAARRESSQVLVAPRHVWYPPAPVPALLTV